MYAMKDELVLFIFCSMCAQDKSVFMAFAACADPGKIEPGFDRK
jgi:hypothetical protein